MPVFRVEKNKGYTAMSNHHLRNKDLSLKAKGLLSQTLSLPEDWDYTLKGLALINREKIDAIRQASGTVDHGIADALGRLNQGIANAVLFGRTQFIDASGQLQIHTGGQRHIIGSAGIGGQVGDDHAAKSPLIPQNTGQQRLMAFGGAGSDIVVGGHHAVAIGGFDGDLKGSQVNLADGLLVGPSAHRIAVRILIVQRKVLDVGNHALFHSFLADGGAKHAGEMRVLGEVLEAAAAKGSAVDIHGGRVPAGNVRVEGKVKLLGSMTMVWGSLVPLWRGIIALENFSE